MSFFRCRQDSVRKQLKIAGIFVVLVRCTADPQNTVSRLKKRISAVSFLGINMLRARKYRFALCFRVLSNHYVTRSAYANVFKFKRENKRFESQSKLQMFPLVSGRVSLLNTIIFSDTLSRIIRVRNIAHPRNFGMLFIYYSCTIFQFLDSIY